MMSLSHSNSSSSSLAFDCFCFSYYSSMQHACMQQASEKSTFNIYDIIWKMSRHLIRFFFKCFCFRFVAAVCHRNGQTRSARRKTHRIQNERIKNNNLKFATTNSLVGRHFRCHRRRLRSSLACHCVGWPPHRHASKPECTSCGRRFVYCHCLLAFLSFYFILFFSTSFGLFVVLVVVRFSSLRDAHSCIATHC